jgi:hypothetical protein
MLILLWAVLGGLWRRAFGGWLGLPRWATYVLMAPLTLPFWLAMPWDALWPYEALAGVAVIAACLLFFVVSLYPGGRYDDDREVLLKYGPFGIGYVLARRHWPDEWRLGGFVDGWSSVGELSLGASFWGVFGILWVIA